MKMLLIHCDYFSYTTTKPTKFAEEIADECKSCGIKDALVIFVTVEKEDIADNEKLINKSAEEIIARAKEVGAKALVLYPFVHLSEKIGPPDVAAKIVDELSKKLVASGYRVNKAPFGWEKVFSLTSKGHPLAESFKTIRI